MHLLSNFGIMSVAAMNILIQVFVEKKIHICKYLGGCLLGHRVDLCFPL